MDHSVLGTPKDNSAWWVSIPSCPSASCSDPLALYLQIYTFGCNDEGALGRDTSAEGSETTPGLVELQEKVVQVSAGDSHTAALTEDGRVFVWGSFRVR